jgi:hypothetical protein
VVPAYLSCRAKGRTKPQLARAPEAKYPVAVVVGVPAYKRIQETAEHPGESSPDFHVLANIYYTTPALIGRVLFDTPYTCGMVA